MKKKVALSKNHISALGIIIEMTKASSVLLEKALDFTVANPNKARLWMHFLDEKIGFNFGPSFVETGFISFIFLKLTAINLRTKKVY